jgi:hypothetical protein
MDILKTQRLLRRKAWHEQHSPRAHAEHAARLDEAIERRNAYLSYKSQHSNCETDLLQQQERVSQPLTTSRAERLLFRLGLLTPAVAGFIMFAHGVDTDSNGFFIGGAFTLMIPGSFCTVAALTLSTQEVDHAITFLKKPFLKNSCVSATV